MLNFFRKIRAALLAEGKTGNYLKYAFGEIILVVIGILIALSINNWNEQQKLNRYERKMLNEIHTSLQADFTRCQLALSRLNELYIANDSIIRFIKTEVVDVKSVVDYFDNTSGNMEIEFQTSAYESLKAKGLDIVSNDSLRIDLSNLYDFEYPRIQANLSNYNIHLRNEWRPFMLDNFQYKAESNPNQITRYPIDLDKLISNPKMENILILNRFLANIQANNLQNVMNDIESITDRIETFLRK